MEDEHLKQFSEIIESYASNNGVCLTLTDYDYKHSLYVPNVPKDKKWKCSMETQYYYFCIKLEKNFK